MLSNWKLLLSFVGGLSIVILLTMLRDQEGIIKIPQTSDLAQSFSTSVNHLNVSEGVSVISKRFSGWEKVFEFVPNGLQNCSHLFKDTTKKGKPFDAEYQGAYDKFLKEVEKHKITEGFSAFYTEENLAYYQAAVAPFVKTVCETGFNAGHSSFMWLQAKPDTMVYSFDIGAHGYAKLMATYLQRTFPGRLRVQWGDSTKTLPAFRKAHPAIKCDLLVIDGGHNNRVCQSDFENFKRMASPDNILILDNYPDDRLNFLQELGNVWEHGKQNGQIIEVFQCNYRPQSEQGFSMGRINKAAMERDTDLHTR